MQMGGQMIGADATAATEALRTERDDLACERDVAEEAHRAATAEVELQRATNAELSAIRTELTEQVEKLQAKLQEAQRRAETAEFQLERESKLSEKQWDKGFKMGFKKGKEVRSKREGSSSDDE